MLTLYDLPLGPPLEKNGHESTCGLSMGLLETLVASLWFSCHIGQNLEHKCCGVPVLSFSSVSYFATKKSIKSKERVKWARGYISCLLREAAQQVWS